MKKAITAALSLLLGGALCLFFAGCAATETPEADVSEPPICDEVPEEPAAVKGIAKDDPYTWFDAVKEDLPTREQCQKIAVGMRLNEVIKKLGRPQRDIGFGAALFQFDVAGGSVFTVTFVKDPASGAASSDYDKLVVEASTFDMGIPDHFFPAKMVLNDLYPWMKELEAEDILKVRCETAPIGVAPYDHWRSISYSADEADIAEACRLFTSSLHAISRSEGEIDGGGYVQYDFITAEKTCSVTISNRVVLIDGQYYHFDGALAALTSPEVTCNAFITDTDDDPYEIFTYGEEAVKVGEFHGLGEFEFRKCDGYLQTVPRYLLKSAGGVDLLILSARQFLIEGDANTAIYEITGDKDFAALFAGEKE